MIPAGCRNAFTLIRWFFAVSIVFFHGSVVAGCPYFWFVDPHSAISAFFVMSGMLTYAGYLRRPGAWTFYARRARRIGIPYATVILLAAVAGIFLSTLGAKAYLSDAGTAKYLAANLTFLNFLSPELPGVFASNNVTAVNASLWTMKVEVAFYLLLPIIAAFVRRCRPARAIAVMYLLSVAWNLIFLYLQQSTGNSAYDILRRQIFGQMMYFAAGMAAAHMYTHIMRKKYTYLAAGAALWLICGRFTALRPIEPVAIAATLTVLAYGSTRLADLSAKVPNLTYEVFLLHFPVFQTLAATGFFAAAGFPPALAAGTGITLLFSVALHRATNFLIQKTER